MITMNTIKELENLKAYCEKTHCDNCPFDDKEKGDCILNILPFDLNIREILEKFVDNAKII